MAEIACSDRKSASPWAVGSALQRALKGAPSELLQSSSLENTELPRLCIIQKPISSLSPEVLYRQIQYLVEEDDWAGQGEEVEAPVKSEEPGA